MYLELTQVKLCSNLTDPNQNDDSESPTDIIYF
jgi:hypothetical protein